MALELEFEVPGDLTKASAVVVLNPVWRKDESGPPRLTTDCATMGDLEGQLKLLEQQIARIRDEARRKFIMAGISN